MLIAIIMALNVCAESYSSEFVTNYSNVYLNNDDTYLVIPRENGYVLVKNIYFKVFEYPLHKEQFASYHDFLCAVLNDKTIELIYHKWNEIRIKPLSFKSEEEKEHWLNRRLQNDDGRLKFSQHINNRVKYRILKLMFDSGYYVGKMEYDSYWYFYKELSHRMDINF